MEAHQNILAHLVLRAEDFVLEIFLVWGEGGGVNLWILLHGEKLH